MKSKTTWLKVLEELAASLDQDVDSFQLASLSVDFFSSNLMSLSCRHERDCKALVAFI